MTDVTTDFALVGLETNSLGKKRGEAEKKELSTHRIEALIHKPKER